jgi:purine-binding chemotaxis protein CheW
LLCDHAGLYTCPGGISFHPPLKISPKKSDKNQHYQSIYQAFKIHQLPGRFAVQQFIGFRLQNGEYAVPIVKVREIINIQPITTLPNSPEYLEGVINIRGSVTPIINLKKRLQLPEDGARAGKIIVISCGDATCGILIDSISGVVTIDEKSIESSDRISRNGDISCIDGIAKLDARLIIILNAQILMSRDGNSVPGEPMHEAMREGLGKTMKASTAA